MEGKVLDLVLAGQWYDMIERGEKPTEFRVCNPHYASRICTHYDKRYNTNFSCYKQCDWAYKCSIKVPTEVKQVRLRRGYTKISMLFEVRRLYIAEGEHELGAPYYPVFNIELGKKLSKQQNYGLQENE